MRRTSGAWICSAEKFVSGQVSAIESVPVGDASARLATAVPQRMTVRRLRDEEVSDYPVQPAHRTLAERPARADVEVTGPP
jgi:hypothetical protein